MSTSSPAGPGTFADLLAETLRRDASRPLVTFYDDATGERVELSVTTYANWVAKTAGLVQDELDVERGGVVLVDLPTHWFGPVWLGAAWSLGLAVTTDPARAADADLVVCGPDGVDDYAGEVGSHPVVAISLRPLGGRFVEPLPAGVVDYAAVVLGQPDAFLPLDPAEATDLAWLDGTPSTQRELLASAAAAGDTGRLLTDVNPCSEAGVTTLLAPLWHGGGTVWVAHPDEDRWQHRYDEERATAELRAEPA